MTDDATKMKQERDLALAELETLRMQLVGCGVAAMQNTERSKAGRITKDSPYWSASYGDVCRAVDAEIEARENYQRACETITRMHAASVGEITGPIRGVVEDVADVKSKLDSSLAECERLNDTLDKLVQWSDAYPIAVFPEPDFLKAQKVLSENGMTLDAISSSNMRRVIIGVREIIDAARGKP